MKARKLARQTLYQAVWTRPVTKVAAEYGVSDVALRKVCNRMEIPTPPRGYWRKRQLGHTVEVPRLPRLSAKGVDCVHLSGTDSPRHAEPTDLPNLDELRAQLASPVRTDPRPLTERLRTWLTTDRTDQRGFYPVSTDTSEKRHNVPKECLCPSEESLARSSSAKRWRSLASPA